MTSKHIVIPLDEFSDNLTSILHRVVEEQRVFWVEGEAGDYVEVRAVRKRQRATRKQAADLAAFVDAAGSWNDVDTDAFVREVREQRDQSYRSPVDL